MDDPESGVRPCGDCAMCCKLLRIDKATAGGEEDFPYNKAGGEMCKYFKPGCGCTLYGTEQFPSLCKSFLCLWKMPGATLPEEARPDKSRVIFQSVTELPEFPGHPIVRVEVDPNRKPNAGFLNWMNDRLDAGWAVVVNVDHHRLIVTTVPGMQKAVTEIETGGYSR